MRSSTKCDSIGTSVAICIKNDEFCIENDEFCINNDEFNTNYRNDRECRADAAQGAISMLVLYRFYTVFILFNPVFGFKIMNLTQPEPLRLELTLTRQAAEENLIVR